MAEADVKVSVVFARPPVLSVVVDLFDFKSKRRKQQRGGHYAVRMLWIWRLSGCFLSGVLLLMTLTPAPHSLPPAAAAAEARRFSSFDRTHYLRSLLLMSLPRPVDRLSFSFQKAGPFRNAEECAGSREAAGVCDPDLVHIAITLDVEYLRGSIAAVHSVMNNSMCPEKVFFHFVVTDLSLEWLVASIFPGMNFKFYYFDPEIVRGLISPSVRQALEQPLNYARNYLADLLEPCVGRVIYLDSDLVVLDDIARLWRTSLGSRTIGAPEYCHANFTGYFTDNFWSNKRLSGTFAGRQPCYFNTGVMVIDLARWRHFGFTKMIERWMEVQKRNRIYELGSLPPFLLVFAGQVAPIDHRWNQHGLGGDNVRGSCRETHPGPVSLLHWSGSGKPWNRIDSKQGCKMDSQWALYDLFLYDHSYRNFA